MMGHLWLPVFRTQPYGIPVGSRALTLGYYKGYMVGTLDY